MESEYLGHIDRHERPVRPWQGVLMGIVFVIFGLAFLFFSISSIKSYNEKSKTYTEITSNVVDYVYDNEGLRAIVVEYVVDGETYQKTSDTYTNVPKSIGEQVSIKYNPKNPKDAIWTNDSSNIILPIIGALFTIAGVFVIIISIRKGKTQAMLIKQTINNIGNTIKETKEIDIDTQNNMNQQ